MLHTLCQCGNRETRDSVLGVGVIAPGEFVTKKLFCRGCKHIRPHEVYIPSIPKDKPHYDICDLCGGPLQYAPYQYKIRRYGQMLTGNACSLTCYKNLVNKRYGWVYFIRAEGTSMVKIGHTNKRLKKRVGSLQSASPVNLVVERKLFMRDACAGEARMHELFKHRHSHGEWYMLGREDIIGISGDKITDGERFIADTLL